MLASPQLAFFCHLLLSLASCFFFSLASFLLLLSYSISCNLACLNILLASYRLLLILAFLLFALAACLLSYSISCLLLQLAFFFHVLAICLRLLLCFASCFFFFFFMRLQLAFFHVLFLRLLLSLASCSFFLLSIFLVFFGPSLVPSSLAHSPCCRKGSADGWMDGWVDGWMDGFYTSIFSYI